jgi:hypothetical protein
MLVLHLRQDHVDLMDPTGHSAHRPLPHEGLFRPHKSALARCEISS